MQTPATPTRLAIACVLMMTPQAMLGAEWNTRSTDTTLTRDGLVQKLVGKSIVFHDDGQSTYAENGEYSYVYGGGGTWLGHYTLQDDGVVCVTFVTNVSRCDLFVQAQDSLVVITEDGMRFPIRDIISHQ